MALTIGIIFGLLTMFSYGIGKVIMKKAIDKIGPRLSVVCQQAFVSFFIVIAAFFIGGFSFPSKKILLLVIAAPLIGFFGIYYLYKAMEIGKLSIVLPISHSSVIMVVLLSYFLYMEKLSMLQALAIFIIIAGIILISFRYSEVKKIRLTKRLLPGVGFAFVTFFCWGVYITSVKSVVLALSPITAAAYLETMILFYGLLSFFGRAEKRRPNPDSGNALLYCFLGGIVVALGSMCFNMGLNTEAVSIMVPIANSSVFVSLIGARLFLKERVEFNQKMAILLILLGIILISV